MNVDKWSFRPLETKVLSNDRDLFQEKRKMNICFGVVELKLRVYVESIIRCFTQSQKFYFLKEGFEFLRQVFSVFYLVQTTKLQVLIFFKYCENESLNGIKERAFFQKNIEKKQLYRNDKNYYYFCKSNIPVINLIVGSRNMIKISKYMSG